MSRPFGSGCIQAASPEPSGVAARAGPGAIDAMPPRRMELSPSESVAQSNVLGVRGPADAAAGAVRGLHQMQQCGGEARRAADFRGGGFGRQGDSLAPLLEFPAVALAHTGP
ncbi:hypothetical protein PLESTM_001232600 [Pleodorina starrii]|nr:hypothetical protein PLESTM_001232600 [Pleodorina starrii]